ncbi:hypothetical protein [Azospirillum largimobile]
MENIQADDFGAYDVYVKRGRTASSEYTPRLVVSFSGIGRDGPEPGTRLIGWEFEGTFSGDTDTHVIFVRDNSCRWYSDSKEFSRIFDFVSMYIAENRIGHVASVGLSMGGYGALFLSSMMDLDVVVAFSPQTIVGVEPTNSIDRRYDDVFSKDQPPPVADLASLKSRAKNVYVFAGENDWLDVWHVFRIVNTMPMTLRLVPEADHNTASYFKGRYDLRALIRELVFEEVSEISKEALSGLDCIENSTGYFYMESNIHALEGDISRAIEYAELSIRGRPHSSHFHYHLSKLHNRANNLPKAIEYCYLAVKLASPDNMGLRHALVQLLMKARRFNEAEDVFCDCLAKNINNGWTYHYLGLFEAERGRIEMAVIAHARAVCLLKNEPVFMKSLESMLAKISLPLLSNHVAV